jgi:hypothetical protein
MPNAIADRRSKFNGLTGDLLTGYANLTELQRYNALEFQGKLAVVAELEKNAPEKTNLFAIADNAQLDALLAQKGASAEAIVTGVAAATTQQISSKDVPLLGDVAVKLGYVKKEAVHGLMAAQAAERMMLAAAGKGGAPVEFVKKAIETGDFSHKMAARPFIGGSDPEEVVKAQSANHLADILAASIAIKPELATNAKITNALNALVNLSVNHYQSAAQTLGTLSLDPASGIKAEASAEAAAVAGTIAQVSGNDGRSPENSLRILKEGALEAASNLGLDAPKLAALSQLIETRAQQAGIAPSQGQQPAR